MIYALIFIILASISYWLWRYKIITAEVALNAADIKANGSQDNLQRGYHGRRGWARIWPGLACCVVPAAPLAFANWGVAALGFLAMAALLAGAFARDFTPKLNLARIANGDTWLATEWYASPASKSWPDAGAWKETRSGKVLLFTQAEEQIYANATMKKSILSTWLWCRIVAGAAAISAIGVAAAAHS